MKTATISNSKKERASSDYSQEAPVAKPFSPRLPTNQEEKARPDREQKHHLHDESYFVIGEGIPIGGVGEPPEHDDWFEHGLQFPAYRRLYLHEDKHGHDQCYYPPWCRGLEVLLSQVVNVLHGLSPFVSECMTKTQQQFSTRKNSILHTKSQTQQKNQHFCCFNGLNLIDSWIKKFSSPKIKIWFPPSPGYGRAGEPTRFAGASARRVFFYGFFLW
ncbi:MAG: hypothetical protein Q8O75_00020 [bacterium]|nr:hypothetical protein [bacterium]